MSYVFCTTEKNVSNGLDHIHYPLVWVFDRLCFSVRKKVFLNMYVIRNSLIQGKISFVDVDDAVRLSSA